MPAPAAESSTVTRLTLSKKGVAWSSDDGPSVSPTNFHSTAEIPMLGSTGTVPQASSGRISSPPPIATSAAPGSSAMAPSPIRPTPSVLREDTDDIPTDLLASPKSRSAWS